MFSFLNKSKRVNQSTQISKYTGKCVSILREFKKPPYGGGNQFMLALKKGMEDLGVVVVNNEISKKPDAYIFDSAWLDKNLLRALRKLHKPLIAHRIDGPIQLYRGSDRAADEEIFELNTEFATVTVIQSQFTLKNLLSLGYRPINPVIIYNAVNPAIFYKASVEQPRSGKIKIVSASWSDNPNKGGATYKWLDENLNFSKVEYTFVGRIKEKLNNITVIPPVDSEKLSQILRRHHVYITASENDPCSNSLLEGLACGLPSIYRNSGGHPELVKDAGLPFDDHTEIPALIDKVWNEYDHYKKHIRVNQITDIALHYLDALFNLSNYNPDNNI